MEVSWQRPMTGLPQRLTAKMKGHDFQIQKYFIRHGQVYNIIVRGLDPEQMAREPELVDGIEDIVHSFAFIEKGGGRRTVSG